MKLLGKKAITGLVKLAAVILAIILLVLLIKYNWDVNAAFRGLAEILGL